jgi:hypothetical protein
MPIKRLGILKPVAINTTYTLTTADVTAIASVVIANIGNVDAAVTVYVDPIGAGGAENQRAYILSDVTVSVGQSLETFRFPVDVGDIIKVRSTTTTVSFSTTLLYEGAGRTNVQYSA